jgi:hypothetical protein
MENKINYGRIILGGILAAIVLFAVGFLVHGIILESHYEYFKGISVMSFPKKYGMLVHIVGTLVSGICLAVLYAVARKFGGPGPMTAIKVGFVVGLFTIGGVSAEYAFYNLGKMIPLMTLVDSIVGCVLATLVAGLVYKD